MATRPSKPSSQGIGALGSRSAGSVYCGLVVHTRAGKEIRLMGGRALDGRLHRDRMEALRTEFERAVGAAKS